MLDLESAVQGSILTGGNILLLVFLFSCSKASDANIRIIANGNLVLLRVNMRIPEVGPMPLILKNMISL